MSEEPKSVAHQAEAARRHIEAKGYEVLDQPTVPEGYTAGRYAGDGMTHAAMEGRSACGQHGPEGFVPSGEDRYRCVRCAYALSGHEQHP